MCWYLYVMDPSIKRRLHILDKILNSVMGGMYITDYPNPEHFLLGIYNEIIELKYANFFPEYKSILELDDLIIEEFLRFRKDRIKQFYRENYTKMDRLDEVSMSDRYWDEWDDEKINRVKKIIIKLIDKILVSYGGYRNDGYVLYDNQDKGLVIYEKEKLWYDHKLRDRVHDFIGGYPMFRDSLFKESLKEFFETEFPDKPVTRRVEGANIHFY